MQYFPVRRWFAVLLLLVAWPVAAQNAAGTPEALVRGTVDEVLGVIKQNRDRKVLLQVAEQKVLPHFDFETMTRLAVGRSWREATAEQQKSLQQEFRSLLVSTYTAALNQADTADAAVEVKGAQPGSDRNEALVRSVVKQPGRQPVMVDYRMTRKDSGWKVYDVIVENLSLVTNYRSSFQAEIARGGIDGLIRSLQTKNRQLAGG